MPHTNHRETVIIRRDSGAAPPRELDLCNYSDSADTVIAYEDDSLLVAFRPDERDQGEILAVFSLQEGLLFYSGSGSGSSSLRTSRTEEEGDRKAGFAMTAAVRHLGIRGAAKGMRKTRRPEWPGFAFGNFRFDTFGSRLAGPLHMAP